MNVSEEKEKQTAAKCGWLICLKTIGTDMYILLVGPHLQLVTGEILWHYL
jgi:hypothetical protein